MIRMRRAEVAERPSADCSGVGVPPTEDRNDGAGRQESDVDADEHPVLDWLGVPIGKLVRPRIKPVQDIRIVGADFSLDKAIPHVAPAIEEQIDRDKTRDDFVKEKLPSVH